MAPQQALQVTFNSNLDSLTLQRRYTRRISELILEEK
jgi:hypothetical protein